MKLSEILRAGKQRIETLGWGQGEAVYLPEGGPYCAATAMFGVRCAHNAASGDAIEFFEKANGLAPDIIADWNDAPERTLPEVLAAYDKAIAAAEAQEQSK